MKYLYKITLAVVVLVSFSFMIIIIGYFCNIVFPWERNEAIQEAIEMGGLSELPFDAKNIKVERCGSIFSGQYIIEFKSSENELEKWIKKCIRLKNNAPKLNGNTKTYEVYPGENDAMGGDVKIEKNKVIINMSWS